MPNITQDLLNKMKPQPQPLANVASVGNELMNLPNYSGVSPLALKTSSTGFAKVALDNLASVQINANLLFDTDATYDVGSSTVGVNDLHLGSGGVINFDGGDVTLTHATDTLTLAGGSLVANDVSLTAGSALRTRTTAGNTLLFQARDVDASAYVTFATLTANGSQLFNILSLSVA